MSAMTEEEKIFERNKSDLCKVLSLVEGRRVMFRLMDECHAFTDITTTGEQAWVQLGVKKIGMKWFNRILGAKPDILLQMIKEAESEKNSKKSKDADSADG